jgi:predicted flavoprotein YhiN
LQGIKFEAKASFYVEDKLISEKSGDLIVTHYGLSGPAIMSQTRNIAPYMNKKVSVKIDFIPEKTSQELDQTLKELFDSRGAKLAKNALIGLMPLNLIPVILKESRIDAEIKCANISKLSRQEIIKNLKSFNFTVTKPRSFKEAQVTRGGVSAEEIDQNLESKKI